MNEPKRLPRPCVMQHLTAIELRFINLARRHRANYLRVLRRLKSSSHQKNRRSLLATDVFSADCPRCSHGRVGRAGLRSAASTAPYLYCRTNPGLAVTPIGHGPPAFARLRHGRQARGYIAAICLALLAMCATNVHAGVSTPAQSDAANAGQHAESVGPVILGYERAHFLAPRDSAVTEHLRVTREKAGLNVPAVPVWQRPAHWLGFDGWAILGSFALLTLCAASVGRHSMSWLSRRASTAIAVNCGVVLVLASSALGLRWDELNRAVIQSADATVHIAPAASAQSTFVLKAGDLVTAKHEHGDFVFVRTLDLRSGWVNKSDLERIIPTTNLSPM